MSVVRTLIGNIKGPKGDTGETGATGPQGTAASVRVGSTTTATYGTPASVTNSGTEEEAVLDFVIPQGAPGEEVTDASDLTLSEITASSASYPTLTAGETLKVAFGKIQKFLSDLRNNFVSKAMMTTSTNVSTAGQYVADAAAIKTLNDNLQSLASDIANNYTDYIKANDYVIRVARVGKMVTVSGVIYGTGTAGYLDLKLPTMAFGDGTILANAIVFMARNQTTGNVIQLRCGGTFSIYREASMTSGEQYSFAFAYCSA